MASPWEEKHCPPGRLARACHPRCLKGLLPLGLTPRPSPLHISQLCSPRVPAMLHARHPKGPSERVQLSDIPHCHPQPQQILHSNEMGNRREGSGCVCGASLERAR